MGASQSLTSPYPMSARALRTPAASQGMELARAYLNLWCEQPPSRVFRVHLCIENTICWVWHFDPWVRSSLELKKAGCIYSIYTFPMGPFVLHLGLSLVTVSPPSVAPFSPGVWLSVSKV